jgi:general secretion pathway protein A
VNLTPHPVEDAFAAAALVPPHPAEAADPFDALMGEPMSTPPAPAADVVAFVPAGDFMSAYGLRENPFPDSVHPAFFFRTEDHAEAFRSMMLSAEFKTSLAMVTGPSGTGKTLLSQLLLNHFEPSKYEVVLLLVTPGLSKTGLLREILAELNIALPVGMARVQDLMKLLSNHIIDLHEQGRRLVIIIDECHLLHADCLHVVRTISNIETPEEKLTTCLLFGESRLAERLEHPSFASLRNRIFLRAELHPLTLAETTQYVKYRLMTAGRLADLFTPAALELLHTHSGGIPRSINKLAMLSLIEGGRRQRAMIDDAAISEAAKRL